MQPFSLFLASGLALLAPSTHAHVTTKDGPYKVLRTVKVGGDGGFDYVTADPAERSLYIARTGSNPRISVYNLDTLEPKGELAKITAHGAVIDAKSHHAFSSSKPVVEWDSRTLQTIKTTDVTGNPDGMLADPATQNIYVLSHSEPNITVIDAKTGSVTTTLNIDGAPEQSVTDGKGRLYSDLEDTGEVAVVDTKTYKLITKYSLKGKAGGNTGLAIDIKNHILFVACREPAKMVMLDAKTGNFLAELPIGEGCDGVVFNPKTHEVYSSQRDGTLTIIEEVSPTSFQIEQTVKTMPWAKTLTFDPKTGKIFLIGCQYKQTSSAASTNGKPSRGTMVPGSFTILEVGK